MKYGVRLLSNMLVFFVCKMRELAHGDSLVDIIGVATHCSSISASVSSSN